MPVSEKDREYMRCLGAIKAESHEVAQQESHNLSIAERVRRSWALYLAMRTSAQLEAREDDPTAFYDRARELGLYRP